VALPDGRTLLAIASGTTTHSTELWLWDPATGTPTKHRPIHRHSHYSYYVERIQRVLLMTSMALADGRTLLATLSSTDWNNDVRLWDTATGNPAKVASIGNWSTSPSCMTSVALPDGRILLVTDDQKYYLAKDLQDKDLHLWDPATGHPVGRPLTGLTDLVTCVTSVALPDGRNMVAAGSKAGTVLLWDLSRRRALHPHRWGWWSRLHPRLRLAAHTGSVNCITSMALPDGRTILATGSEDRSVRLWDPATGNPVGQRVIGHARPVSWMAGVTLPDRRTLLATAGSGDETIRLWSPATDTSTSHARTSHTDWITCMTSVTLSDGSSVLATGGSDGTVCLWDPATGTPASDPFTSHTGAVSCMTSMRLPGAGTLLATGGEDGLVRLWDPATRTVNDPLGSLAGGVTSLTIVRMRDGRTVLAAGGWDGKVCLWDPATSTPAITPFRIIVYGIPGVRNPATGTRTSWSPSSQTVLSMSSLTLPDGRTMLATGSHGEETVRLWDVDAAGLGSLTGHTGTVWCMINLAMPDGRTVLATGGSDGTVRLWDPATRTPASDPFTGHTDAVSCMTSMALPDGRTLLAAGAGNKLLLWDAADPRPVFATGLPDAVVALTSFGPRLAAATSIMLMTMSLD
jgi:WD40 repeat protein